MKRAWTILSGWLFTAAVLGQDMDPFFSGRAPVILDPSRTGFGPGLSAGLLHQDQWLQVPGAWRSDVLHATGRIYNQRRKVASWAGLGALATREQQAAAGSRITSFGVLSAMHLRSGHRSFLSCGLEVRWASTLVGDAAGGWASQYDGLRYDPSVDPGEVFMRDAYSSVASRAGLSWSLKQDAESALRRERDVLVVGVAADNLGRLMLRDGASPAPVVPVRYTMYVLGELPHEIWDNGLFAGELIGHVQGPFHTGRFNIYAGRHLDNLTREKGAPMLVGFKAGLGYRYRDALLVNAAVDLGRATLGLAYGWSVVNVNTMAAGRRTFEMVVQIRTG